MRDCPSEERLAGLAEGTCVESDAESLRAHVARCDRCAGWMADARANDDLLRDIRGGLRAVSGSEDRSTHGIGAYEILGELSRGGQGIVYEAVQRRTRRPVAIKVLVNGADASPTIQRRFDREIELAASLRHPNIVGVMDSGATPDGRQFCVMDRVRGAPLDRHIRQNHLALNETMRLFRTLCDAVNYAHQKGVIHRDLKPSNILVDTDGEVKVLDFGLAKPIAGRAETSMSITGQVMGTVPYMSPEQTRGDPDAIDIRSDVYSLGVVLYHVLTGQFPYPVTGSVAEVLAHITETPPMPPRRRWSSDSGLHGLPTRRRKPNGCPIDDEVETIVLRALAKEPQRRYQSAGELSRDIGHYLNGEPIEAKRDSHGYVLRKTLRRYRVSTAIVTTCLALVMVALVVSAVSWRRAALDRDTARQAQAAAETEKARADQEAHLALRQLHANRMATVVRQQEQSDVVAMRRTLNECPEGLRGWEWYWLRRQSDQSLLTLRGHKDHLLETVFSPNGRRMASVDQDGNVKFWDAVTGRQLASIQCASDAVFSAAFDSALSRVACGRSDGCVDLWDLEGGRMLTSWYPHSKPISSLAFHPDGGRIVSGGHDGMLKVSDAATGGELLAIRGHDLPVMAAVFSPDGRWIASGGEDGAVKLWDADTGQEIRTLRGRGVGVARVVFSPDATQIASGDAEGVIRMWDVATGQDLGILRDTPDQVMGMAFDPTGERLASVTGYPRRGPAYGKLNLYDTCSGFALATLRGHEGQATCVAFSPDGSRIVTGSVDMTVMLWDADGGRIASSLSGHRGAVTCVAISPDSRRIVSGGIDKTLRLWDGAGGRVLATMRGHTNTVWRAVFSPDGRRIASGGFDGEVRVWDAADGRLLRTLERQAAKIFGVAFSPDGKQIAASGEKQTVKLWDAESGAPLGVLTGHEGSVAAIAFSPDGSRLASASEDRTVRVWDVRTERTMLTLVGHETWVWSVAFSPDGRWIVSTGADGTARVWDASSGRELRKMYGGDRAALAVAFSPDGQRIVGGTLRMLKLWDAVTGEELLTLPSHDGRVTSVAFGADGRSIATGCSDSIVRVWRIEASTAARPAESDFSARAADQAEKG